MAMWRCGENSVAAQGSNTVCACTQRVYAACVHSACSQRMFTARVFTARVFTARVHSVCSQRVFASRGAHVSSRHDGS